jgi:hypothetical protein
LRARRHLRIRRDGHTEAGISQFQRRIRNRINRAKQDREEPVSIRVDHLGFHPVLGTAGGDVKETELDRGPGRDRVAEIVLQDFLVVDHLRDREDHARSRKDKAGGQDEQREQAHVDASCLRPSNKMGVAFGLGC